MIVQKVITVDSLLLFYKVFPACLHSNLTVLHIMLVWGNSMQLRLIVLCRHIVTWSWDKSKFFWLFFLFAGKFTLQFWQCHDLLFKPKEFAKISFSDTWVYQSLSSFTIVSHLRQFLSLSSDSFYEVSKY